MDEISHFHFPRSYVTSALCDVVKEIKNANCHQIVKRPWATSFKVIDNFCSLYAKITDAN